MSKKEIPDSVEKTWDLVRPPVMVKDENRHDSFSSVELDTALRNFIMDSIDFDSTMFGGAKASEATTSTSDEKIPVLRSVEKLILASKALRRTDQSECVYTLRRLAMHFAVDDGMCKTKGEFANIYKQIELPGDIDDEEPEYVNDLPGQKWTEYAHSRAKEAVEALKAAGFENDELVGKLSKCLDMIWASLEGYRKE